MLAEVRDAVAEVSSLPTERFINYLAPMIVTRVKASGLIRLAHPERATTPEDLYAGIPYTTAMITSAINTLADRAREKGIAIQITDAPSGTVAETLASSAAGRQFQELVNDFLAQYGARTARLYLPFSNRSWREDPETFYALFAATLRGKPAEQDARNPAEDIEHRLPRPLRRWWRTVTRELQARHIAREGTVYLIEEFFCFARAGIDEAARRLVDRQQLNQAEDVRFLYFHEVENALANREPLQPTITRRRRKRPAAEAIWWERDQNHPEGELRGQPASAGQAIGPARIVRSHAEFNQLQPGDILVCPYTDPTWTPLFALAAGVVADTGGPLSHAAIVAREYGIPAVLGAERATNLDDGTQLLVDGSTGNVSIIERDEP